MPKSTRRQTMAAAAAACLLPICAATRAAADPNRDAELIRLCSLMAAKCAGLERVQSVYGSLRPDAATYETTKARVLTLDAELQQIAPQIAAIRAVTAAGIKARAAALQAFAPVDFGIGDLIAIDWDGSMLAALLADLAGDVA